MKLTIDISDTDVHAAVKLHKTIQGRERQGPQTVTLGRVLSAIADAAPTLFNLGDEVTINSDGEISAYVIDSFVHDGQQAVICTVDRVVWECVPTSVLTHDGSDAD